MDLDHVALGLRDVSDALSTFVGHLGAVVLDGGQAPGFRIVQVRLGRVPKPEDPGEGMTVELMEPWAVDRFDFLSRFLDRNGEGPHHMTFKVRDLRAEIARLETHGLTPVRTQLTNPWWREAFFHPRDTFGTVIQLAEATFNPALVDAYEEAHGEGGVEGEFGSVEWWPPPPPRAEPRAVLRRVVLAAPQPDQVRTFLSGVLGGQVVAGNELAWPGGGRVAVEERPGEPAGIDRLECERAGAAEDLVIGGARVHVGPPPAAS
ncbi:MAG: VOC family protein [Actinobacteria bacterium]|nr:VOC family protein [Actinomycetota bacterium]